MSETPFPALVLASVDLGVGWFLQTHLGPVGYPLLVAGVLVLLVAALRALRDSADAFDPSERPERPERG